MQRNVIRPTGIGGVFRGNEDSVVDLPSLGIKGKRITNSAPATRDVTILGNGNENRYFYTLGDYPYIGQGYYEIVFQLFTSFTGQTGTYPSASLDVHAIEDEFVLDDVEWANEPTLSSKKETVTWAFSDGSDPMLDPGADGEFHLRLMLHDGAQSPVRGFRFALSASVSGTMFYWVEVTTFMLRFQG